jgi:hypothetical protein
LQQHPSEAPGNFTIPLVAQRAGMLFAWDAAGRPTVIASNAPIPALLPVKKITAAAYAVGPNDDGYRLDVQVACLLTVGNVAEQWGCTVFHDAVAGDVTMTNGPGCTLANTNDATGALHRSIAGLGCSVLLWCNSNPDGQSAHVWIEGATKP